MQERGKSRGSLNLTSTRSLEKSTQSSYYAIVLCIYKSLVYCTHLGSEVPITIKIPLSVEVTCAGLSSTLDIDIIDRDVLATSRTTEDVIIPSLLGRSTGYVPDIDVLDLYTICRIACWSTVKVILLNVDTVDGNVLDANVLEGDVGDEPCSIGV